MGDPGTASTVRGDEQQLSDAEMGPVPSGLGVLRAGAAGCPKLNILIINKDLPKFPGGIAIEFLNTVGLAERAATVGLVSMAHTPDDLLAAEALRKRNVRLYLWQSPAVHKDLPVYAGHSSQLRQYWQKIFPWLRAFPARPLEAAVADLEFRNLAGPLLEALTDCYWHVLIVVQTSQAAALDYLPRFPVNVLVAHDIRSVLFMRRARIASPRRFWRREGRRYFEFERRYAARYDLWVAVSQADAQWVSRNYQPRSLITLPLPLDATYFTCTTTTPENPNVILFTGLMNHPPNVDAAVFFACQVLPLIRKDIPGAEFWIVGKNPAPEVTALANLSGVTVTGEVPDTRPYFASAAAVVVPLRFASGARYKILEAWAMEKCVVSTSVGAEGLDYQHGVNLFIADDAQTMAATVVRVLRDPELRNSVRRNGRQVVLSSHDPHRIAGAYYGRLAALVRQAAAQEPPMRICLDLRWMLPGLAGGVENLARSFVNELIRLDAWNQYTLLLPARCRYDFDLRSRQNFRTISLDSPSAVLDRWLYRLRQRLHATFRLDHWESPAVRALRFLRSLDSSIAYSFTGYIFPDLQGLRHVVQVPDLQHEYYPGFFTPAALEERRRLFGQAVRQAEHIVTISEFSRRCVIEKLGVPPGKVTAIPLAADPIFRPGPVREDDTVLRRYGLERQNYLLFPGHTWWHKNHKAATAALAILRAQYGISIPLVCTGNAREAQAALEAQIRDANLRDQVRFLGYCLREEMPALYRNAACLVFPSLFEGFGMPVLEAMASGCPVVCSNVTSLPEVAGNAALMVNPENHEDLAHALAQVLQNPRLREELVRRGLQQASRFTWRRYALGVLAVLHRVHRKIVGLSVNGASGEESA